VHLPYPVGARTATDGTATDMRQMVSTQSHWNRQHLKTTLAGRSAEGRLRGSDRRELPTGERYDVRWLACSENWKPHGPWKEQYVESRQ